MHPGKKYSKPKLRLIDPQDARWKQHLPQARTLIEEALNAIQDVDPDIVVKLKALLRLIDAEIAKAKADAERAPP